MTSGPIGLDETVTWRATHFGIPFTMTSRVTALEHPHRFVDEQVRGPFGAFHDEYIFEPLDGVTRMIDRIQFDAPVGAIGRLAERDVLAAHLQKLIAVRGQYLKREVERRSDENSVTRIGDTERSSPTGERQ